MQPTTAPDMVTTYSWLIEATIYWVLLVLQVQRAESCLPRITHVSMSIWAPSDTVAMPVQLLMLSCSLQWVAYPIADAGCRVGRL